MPYLQELMTKFINYEMSTSIVWLVISSVLFITGTIILIYGIKEDTSGFAVPIGAITMMITFPIIIWQILDIVKCNTFPEMMLINYIQFWHPGLLG